MYVSGRIDIFDMVDIDLFTVIALNMMVLKLGYTGESEPMFYNYLRPLTSLDEGLYALACEDDVRCLATLGIHQFRASIEILQMSPAGSIVANKTEKMLLLTWHESIKTTKEPVCDSVTPSSLPQHDSSTPFDDLDLNLNKEPDVNLNVSHVETQSKLLVSEEPDVGHTQEPILAEVSTQEPIVAEVITQEPIMAEVSTEARIVEEVGTQEFSVEDVVIEDYVSFGEDGEDAEQGNGQEDESTPTNGHIDLPFDNIGITNLVPDDVLEGADVDVVNADGFDNDPGPESKPDSIESRRNLKLYKNDSVRIKARCEGKVLVFTMSQGTG
ncbi:hypothetical protein Tco_1113919 [Tanacetum coccineum]|uniref:Uncharacterized protein n=1 Tax=Tanacetum coccineum TaxID=301880 RepID=A0ABQ5ITJ4_9ASTR